MAKILIFTGAILLLVGLASLYAPGLVNWFGKLPGDINIGKGNSRVYIPITSMLLISIIETLLINLFLKK